jgi:hypothetical protein
MTYGVERMTFRGNTLYDKLHEQFGERAARSVNLGLEANAKKEARRRTVESAVAFRNVPSSRAASRPIPSGRVQGNVRSYNISNDAGTRTHERRAVHAHDRVISEPRASHFASEREIYETRNPYRARINYMKRPVTGKSDLEISIATFPQAYNAGMKAKRVIGAGIVKDRSAAGVRVRHGYRPGESRSTESALDNSRTVMANAYRRGERMRRVTQIETARPTPATAKGIETPKGIEKFIRRARTLVVGKGKHATEIKVKRSPFPIGSLALIIVCTIVVMVMISSFAEMSDYRSQISALEDTQATLERDRARLSGLVENREDIRVIEKIAIEDIGMVSADLAQGRFVSLADYDSVEIIEVDKEENSGVFASVLSSIAENLGEISDYIN